MVLAVLTSALVCVTAVSLTALQEVREQRQAILGDQVATMQLTVEAALALSRAEQVTLQLIQTNSDERQAVLNRQLDSQIVPRVEQALQALEAAHVEDSAAERASVVQLRRAWQVWQRLRDTGQFDLVASDVQMAAINDRLAQQVADIFIPIDQAVDDLVLEESRQAHAAGTVAEHAYRALLRQLALVIAASLAVAGGVVVWLVRSIVPRLRRYGRFATAVAGGEPVVALPLTGADELTDLGRALNVMVARQEELRSAQAGQSELSEALQVAAVEDEVHDLLRRHLERSIPSAQVTVLTRNNSADRLQAATPVPPDSPLAAGLDGACPRSCLAVRFGRVHSADAGRSPLLDCSVCAHGAVSTCSPLLVGAEVIGSVLVQHQQELQPLQLRTVEDSVTAAAPVLGNLRNLALAEFRANSDALTGLPNKRAADDTLKQLIAIASRSLTPLSVALLDLDHFKQINDRYGHASGDTVLAAVGTVLKACLRAGDFAGRFGGEEFLLMFPDTDVTGAAIVAENIRVAIGEVRIPHLDRPVSASIGTATLPTHAGEATGLLRQADRALYAAKAAGRNRVHHAGATVPGTVTVTTPEQTRPSFVPPGAVPDQPVP